jgi:hypothetical protein
MILNGLEFVGVFPGQLEGTRKYLIRNFKESFLRL